MSLDDLRENINRIDGDLVRLLDERAAVARSIADEKAEKGLPLHNPKRESEVLLRLASLSDGSMPPEKLASIFRLVMAETLQVEREHLAKPCSGKNGGKADLGVVVVGNHPTAAGFHRMRLRFVGEKAAFRPGHFFQLKVPAGTDGLFLRRPFAPSVLLPDGFAFDYAVVGKGTEAMANLKPGAEATVLAPLGNGYTLAKPGSHAALVGGGCGGPSLGPLAAVLAESGVKTTVVLGARTGNALIGHDCFNRDRHDLLTATDDGSAGFAGTSVAALEDRLKAAPKDISIIYACGPMAMLKAVAALAEKYGIACEVSLEERMACGFGACIGCAVETKTVSGGTVFSRVCHDGPVFDAKILKWNSA